jgi:hypothetical protein
LIPESAQSAWKTSVEAKIKGEPKTKSYRVRNSAEIAGYVQLLTFRNHKKHVRLRGVTRCQQLKTKASQAIQEK